MGKGHQNEGAFIPYVFTEMKAPSLIRFGTSELQIGPMGIVV